MKPTIVRLKGVNVARKFTDDFCRNAAELIKSGATVKDVARILGCGADNLSKALRARGVVIPLFPKYPHPRKINTLPESEIISQFSAGASVQEISVLYSVSRNVITRVLRDSGIEHRNRSQSAFVRMGKTPADERKRIIGSARKTRFDNLKECASTGKKYAAVGIGEAEFAEILCDANIAFDQQVNIGPYFVDFVVGDIAVEIKQRSTSSAWGLSFSEREKYIIESGKGLFYVVFDTPDSLIQSANEIITRLNFVGGQPSSLRQKWMIWCRSHLVPFDIKRYNVAIMQISPNVVAAIKKADLR